MTFSMISRAASTTAALVTLIALPVAAEGPATFDEARAAAEAAGKPLLVDFFATWCGPCKAFTKASKESEALKDALAGQVVLFKTDAEKGEGLELAQRFDVQSYPTFVLMNAEGAPIDRWLGYGGPEWFIAKLDGATADLMPIREKVRAFAESPTAERAAKLAEIASARTSYGDAIAYYRRAEALDPGTSYAAEILDAMSGGKRTGLFGAEDVVKQARRVLERADIDADAVLNTTLIVRQLQGEDPTFRPDYVACLDRALTAMNDESATLGAYARRTLPIDHALYVEHDADLAIDLKKATYTDGWKDDASKLNSFAWWCFQNSLNLQEAEDLARKAVELAPEGRERANVIDTLAEICNLKGDCGEAVELMKQAAAMDPNNEYWHKQLARFEELLAKQS